MAYLEKLAENCREDRIRLIFAISPVYGEQEPDDLTFIEELCDKYGCELWDYSADPDFCNDQALFKDSSHMNVEGATIYTKKIARRLRGDQ